MNKKNRYRVAVAFAVALALILPGASLIANEGKYALPPDTIVSIDPSTQAVGKGETFVVSVYVEPSEPITGINFGCLYFDQILINANSVTFEGFFDPYPIFPSVPVIDNVNGEIRDVYEVIVGAGSVSADGVFVNISFTAQEVLGTSELDLSDVIISNGIVLKTPVVVNNGTVTVEEYFTLTISVVGNGTTVPVVGVHSYLCGSVVDLEAFADSCWVFAGWSGDINTMDNPTIITMDGDKTVTATFNEIYYDLTMSVVGNGTTTPAPGVHSYLYGSVVDLEAFPDLCWVFAGWSGDINTLDNPTTVLMDGDKSVTATFNEIYYDFTMSVVGNGTTTPAPGVHSYLCGSVVDLEAFPYPGWAFAGWSGDINTIDNPTTVTMDDNKAVTATFRQEWTVCMEIEADIREMDTVCFGEKALASDGIDEFDIPKPGTPPSPYVYGWFATELPPPHDVLWMDYRHYDISNTYQVWDLWIHTSGSGQYTQVTISWDPDDINACEYDYVGLFYMLSGNMVADMKTESSFVYTSDHCCATYFQIRCWDNNCPVGVDDYYETNQGTDLVVGVPGVLGNDYDPDGDSIWVESGSLDTTGTHGSVGLSTDGSFTYTPPLGWYGLDSFNYSVTDGICSDPATVYIEVLELTLISIQPGWNLISVPVGGTCDDPCCLDKTTIIVDYLGDLYSWNEAISAGLILGFTYGWDNGMYFNEYCLESGEGYWMWSYQTVDLLIPKKCDESSHITFLDVGWNLIGVPYTYNLSLFDDVVVVDPSNGTPYYWYTAAGYGFVLEFIYGWDRPDQHYELINADYGGTDTLEVGYGYWVYAYQSCALKSWYP